MLFNIFTYIFILKKIKIFCRGILFYQNSANTINNNIRCSSAPVTRNVARRNYNLYCLFDSK